MNGLWLVDWGYVHRVFCAIMWLVALVLVIVILAHVVPDQTPPAHARPILRTGIAH